MTIVDDPLALDNQVCFTLYAANRAVTALYRPLLDALGLTYPQYLVMLVLWEADRQGAAGEEANPDLPSVSSLGRRLQLDSGTLTPLLKRLEGRGLLARQRHPQDERVVTVELTAEGRSLRGQALDIPSQLLCRTGLALQDAKSLRASLQSLLDQLGTSA